MKYTVKLAKYSPKNVLGIVGSPFNIAVINEKTSMNNLLKILVKIDGHVVLEPKLAPKQGKEK